MLVSNIIFVGLIEYSSKRTVIPLDFRNIPVKYPCYKQAFICNILKLPRLFEGVNIYIDKQVSTYEYEGTTFSVADIKNLILEGSGINLRRIPTPRIAADASTFIPYFSDLSTEYPLCSFYILYDEKKPPELRYNMKELAHKPIKWFFDCILEYKIL